MELEAAIIAVYRGPLEAFVSRRDALAKQLRAAKRREDADRVKLLRKPSRMAWVLDNIVDEDGAAIERLSAAIRDAQGSTDLRIAVETIKAAVHGVAAAAARVAIRAGQPIDANTIAIAVHAVIGEAGALEALRAGRLVEVPEAGGLEMLTVGVSAATAPRPLEAPPASEPAEAAPIAEAARADLRRAEMLLAGLQERSAHAMQSVHDAQKALDVAEREVLNAQAQALARRTDLERARQNAEVAASAMRDAERIVAAARARVISGEG
jgi:hypothetical protein